MTSHIKGEFSLNLLLFYAKQETIGDLQKKVLQMQKPTNSNVVPRYHHRSDVTGVISHLFNLSIDVTRLSEDVQQHSRQLDQMVGFLVKNKLFFLYEDFCNSLKPKERKGLGMALISLIAPLCQ